MPEKIKLAHESLYILCSSVAQVITKAVTDTGLPGYFKFHCISNNDFAGIGIFRQNYRKLWRFISRNLLPRYVQCTYLKKINSKILQYFIFHVDIILNLDGLLFLSVPSQEGKYKLEFTRE